VGQGEQTASGPLTCEDAQQSVIPDVLFPALIHQEGSMKRGTRLVAVGLAALVALAVAATATAAYNTAKLSVTYTGTTTRIVASSAVADDSTARASIVIPGGTTVTAPAAPGTKVGSVQAQVSALALGGALLPLAGDIIVAPPGAIPAASQAACTQGATPAATFLLVLSAAGQTINLPAYVLPTSGATAALGSNSLTFCLPPPDIPVDKGGATFGAKFLSADMTFNGVFSPVAQGAWVGFWTPWQAGNGQINAAGTVASPAVIAPGTVTLTGKRVKGRVALAGKLAQGGTGVVDRVQIWAAVGKAAFKPLKIVTSTQSGTFALLLAKNAKQTSFQARAAVNGRPAPALCTALFSSLPVPCVNATVNGFAAKSKAVSVR
jgi:hypothetical protein